MTSSKSKQGKASELNRRDFLKLMASSTISSLISPRLQLNQPLNPEWPLLRIEQLPNSIQKILRLVPNTIVRPDGYLAIASRKNGEFTNVRLERTNWNIKNSNPWNELKTDFPWGIVLHWFGDRYSEQRKFDFYLRGFNGIRQVDDYLISTSAHFLVGEYPATSDLKQDSLGILQTQKPGPGGIPYEAAHIRYLDYNAYREGRHYFLLALNELNKKYPEKRSILQDFFNQHGVYPHKRTIGIEIAGYDFDNPENYPEPQKIANVLSVTWALMKRYRIPVNNIIGHHEIQLSKSDPGKKFLALIKYLIGVKALIEPDDNMKLLVFGQSLESYESPKHAVQAYFGYLRDYMMLIATPRQVSEWDAWTKFFMVSDIIQLGYHEFSGIDTYYLPVIEPSWQPGYRFIVPENHEGTDIYPDLRENTRYNHTQDIRLMGTGTCMFLGKSDGLHDGKLAVFRHRQADGSEIISSYGHLRSLTNIKVGEIYPGGQVIGHIATPKNPPHGFLHFSIAFGPTWDIYLQKNANIPLNVGPTWIRNYFINPSHYFVDKSFGPGGGIDILTHIPI